MFKRIFFALGVVGLLAGACQTPRQVVPAPVEFTILQLNDVYEIAPLEGGKAGGLARVATVKKELLKENPNTIAVLSGDFLSPSLTGTLKLPNGEKIAGLQMVETLNAMGLDYVTFGNHEFDLKDPGLLEGRINASTFKYISCNAFRKAGDQIMPFTQRIDGRDQSVPKYIIREFSNAAGQKVKLGLTGVVLPFNKQDYVTYAPVETALREAVKTLNAQADVCVAMTHLAIDEDLEMAAKIPGIDLIVGGHDHTNMSHYVEKTVVTKADANAKTVYIHRITYYPGSKAVRVRSTLKKIDDTIPEDAATKTVVDKWSKDVDAIVSQMGYDADRQVLMAKEPLVCREAVVRSEQTNFGQLTTQALEAVWPGADVYLINSGSMRLDDDIAGAVTEFDVLRTFPFGGGIALTELPGDILAKLLKIGLVDNKTEGGYMQMLYVESRDGQYWVRGKAIDPAKKYKVVLPEFVASGKEQNLGFLKDYAYKTNESGAFTVEKTSVRNDIRDIVIYYMNKIGTF